MGDLVSDCPALEPVIEDMIEVANYLWERGWAERNAGNLSVDVTEIISGCDIGREGESLRKLEYTYPHLAGRSYMVTGSRHRFRDIGKDVPHNVCILRVEEDGAGFRLIWGGEAGPEFRPTSEFPTHLRLHEDLRANGAPENVVLHTHPTELIALTHMPEYRDEAALNQALWSIHPEVKVNLPKGVGFVPYDVPGSEALAVATSECFSRGYALVLWEVHGCVARATNILDAFDLIDIATKAAKVLLMCRSADHKPTGLSAEQLDELTRTFGLEEY